MHTYRNRNTGDVVELEERSARLDHLNNWERLEGDEAESATDQRTAVETGIIRVPEGPLDQASVRSRLERASQDDLRELAQEYELDVDPDTFGDDEKTRALIDFLVERFGARPSWDDFD